MTGGLAVTGFFFEVRLLFCAPLSDCYMDKIQVDAADNAAIEPLVAALKNVENPDEKYDMAGSAFKVLNTPCNSFVIIFFPDY